MRCLFDSCVHFTRDLVNVCFFFSLILNSYNHIYKASVSFAFSACHSSSFNNSSGSFDVNSAGSKGRRIDKELRVLARES